MGSERQHFGVVVGVDGSAPSDTAVRWAAREAMLRKLRLTLIHAIATSALPWPATQTPAELRQRPGFDARAIIGDAVRIVEDTVKDGDPVEIDSRFFFSAPVPALVDMSKDADLVVVGARGLGAVRSVSLGSVSTALIRHAHCPVAVIHPEGSPQSRSAHASVLLGVDGSPASELATAVAFKEASLRGARLVALHAWRDSDRAHVPSMEESAVEAAAEKTLVEQLAGWRKRYPDVKVTRIVTYDHPATHLLDRAGRAQLVVVGSRGRGGVARMLRGSVSTAVTQAARTPVIVARSH